MARTIAYRRAKIAHLKKRQRKWLSYQHQNTPIQRGRILHTPKLCSCWMCGNPRKYTGEISVQEKRHQRNSRNGSQKPPMPLTLTRLKRHKPSHLRWNGKARD